MANRTLFEEPLFIQAPVQPLPAQEFADFIRYGDKKKGGQQAFGVAPFAFPQKREDNNKRNIFEEPLFINQYAR